MDKTQLAHLFDGQADDWERRRRRFTLDDPLRRRLLEGADGRILEVAVGAGGNFRFYPPGADITAFDLSPRMIEKARRAAREHGLTADLRVMDTEEADLPERAFDTVVSTLSLCTYHDPLAVLGRMSRWCRDDGHVLLLEHGRSHVPPLPWLLDVLDPFHVRKVGCHLNRDVLNLVSRSALHVERRESHLLGMVHLIWATPEQAEAP